MVPTCLGPGFESWKQRLQVSGDFSAEEVNILRKGLRKITAKAFDRYNLDLAQIRKLKKRFHTINSDVRISPLERARILLDDCRRLGALPFAHLARSGFVAVTLLREAQSQGIISAAAQESFLSTLRTVSHQLTNDARAVAAGQMQWDDFVGNYGHLRPGTYDITSPRYDADPERFLRPLVKHAKHSIVAKEDDSPWQAERGAFFSALEELGLPADPERVERFLRQTIEGREYAKFIFTRNLSSALEELAQVGAQYGLIREELANISIEEIISLRHTKLSEKVVANDLKRRAAEEDYSQRLAAACELPPLITKEDDLDAFVLGSDQPNFIGSGSVIADCINLAEYSTDETLKLAGSIVLIPQADPGYDWLFSQGIAGLVTLYGGANSHMAIRSAEFGLPAAIGIGEQRYRELTQAQVLDLSPGNRLLRVIR